MDSKGAEEAQMSSLAAALKTAVKIISEKVVSPQNAHELDSAFCPYCGAFGVVEDDDVDGLDRCFSCDKYWFK